MKYKPSSEYDYSLYTSLDEYDELELDLICEIDMINAYVESEGLDSINVEIAAAYTLKRLGEQ